MGFSGCGNPALTSLTGLNNLTSIGGILQMTDNNSLPSLSGLENLTSIGGDVMIGSYYDGNSYNDSLTSLTGLDNVTSIGGYLAIAHNIALTSLLALDNIDGGSINGLHIRENNSLSTCEAQSVCDYLASPNGDIEIHSNAPGCNSPEEVEEACGIVGINRLQAAGFRLQVFPNPSYGKFEFKYHLTADHRVLGAGCRLSTVDLRVYDLMGKQVKTLVNKKQLAGEYRVRFDASGLPAGIYLLRFHAGEYTQTVKLIVMR